MITVASFAVTASRRVIASSPFAPGNAQSTITLPRPRKRRQDPHGEAQSKALVDREVVRADESCSSTEKPHKDLTVRSSPTWGEGGGSNRDGETAFTSANPVIWRKSQDAHRAHFMRAFDGSRSNAYRSRP